MKAETDWRLLFDGGRPPLIGMVHLGALPGAPGYAGSMRAIVDAARRDALRLAEAGFDAVLFVNEGDIPFPHQAPQETVAAMAAAVEASRIAGLQMGVEILFDPMASLSVAAATDASFIRGGFIGSWAGTSGFRNGDAATILRRRASLGLRHVGLFGVARAELAWPLSTMPDERRIELAVREGALDAVLVGADPGQSADAALVAAVRSAAPHVPVLANSGVNRSNVTEVLATFDGCLVGSALKDGGDLTQPIGAREAADFVAASRRRPKPVSAQ